MGAQGEADAGRLEALQVLPGRGRPPHEPRRLPGVGQLEVLQPVVLRELHPGALDAARAGRAQAAARDHGPLQARHRLGRQELHEGTQGHLLGLLHARGEEGPAGGLQDHGRGAGRVHPPEWLIYHELVLTTKEYMREVMAIDPKWLTELAPRFFRKADPNQLSKRKRMERIEPLYDRFNDPNAWRLSKRRG